MQSTMPDDRIRRHRLTVRDYYRMAEVGILPPEARVELIDGEIIDMPPIGSRHAGTVEHLAHILRQTVGDGAMIRTQNPVRLDEYSEPQPDLTLLRPRSDFYKSSHPLPSDVLLVIEVADTTLRYDRGVKAALYARHGIPELWIVDLEGQAILRYREPTHGVYGAADEIDVGAAVTVASIPGVQFDLGELFSTDRA
jgi:Uma2 family endonuclease